jgi:hypothetical protein
MPRSRIAEIRGTPDSWELHVRMFYFDHLSLLRGIDGIFRAAVLHQSLHFQCFGACSSLVVQSGIRITLSQYVTEVSSADVLILSDQYSFLDFEAD